MGDRHPLSVGAASADGRSTSESGSWRSSAETSGGESATRPLTSPPRLSSVARVSAKEHHHGGPDHSAAHDHHDEPGEEVLAPDEMPTPLWLPVLGAGLFFVAFILIAAF